MRRLKLNKKIQGTTKKKIFEWCNKNINSDEIKITLLFIPLIIMIKQEIKAGQFDLKNFFDTGIIVAFAVVTVCEILAQLLMKLVTKYTEEAVKLTDEYDKLVDKYYVNKEQMVFIEQNGEKIIFPELILHQKIGRAHV